MTYFDGGKRVVLLIIAFLKERGCREKLGICRIDLSPPFLFYASTAEKHYLTSSIKTKTFSSETGLSETLLEPG